MIPVTPQPEPGGFDADVRQPGLAWLKASGIATGAPIPKGTKPPRHWRKCLPELHSAYEGICAYLCVHIERCAGGISVDHYIAKSKLAGEAYEWSNFRLASLAMNSRKRDYSTVLDPFLLQPDTFFLELVTGRIYANPSLDPAVRTSADETIRRLGLDKPCREMRARRYSDYVALVRNGPNADAVAQLQRYSPFVWYEASRQGLL